MRGRDPAGPFDSAERTLHKFCTGLHKEGVLTVVPGCLFVFGCPFAAPIVEFSHKAITSTHFDITLKSLGLQALGGRRSLAIKVPRKQEQLVHGCANGESDSVLFPPQACRMSWWSHAVEGPSPSYWPSLANEVLDSLLPIRYNFDVIPSGRKWCCLLVSNLVL